MNNHFCFIFFHSRCHICKSSQYAETLVTCTYCKVSFCQRASCRRKLGLPWDIIQYWVEVAHLKCCHCMRLTQGCVAKRCKTNQQSKMRKIIKHEAQEVSFLKMLNICSFILNKHPWIVSNKEYKSFYCNLLKNCQQNMIFQTTPDSN